MRIFNRWNAWRDVGIEHIQHEHKWVVIQTRTRKSDNKRQIRHILIMRWGGLLSEDVKDSFNKIIGDNK
jgi:hypothetical protein